MAHGCTLFIFLMEDADSHARYFAAIIPRDLSERPLAPTRQTQEISAVRNDLIDKLQDFRKLSEEPDEFKKKVGLAIAERLGLNEFFHTLNEQTADSREVTLLTNDVQIPWEWAYFSRKQKFFCELYDYGRILPEKARAAHSTRKPLLDRDLKSTLESKHVILLYDDYTTSSSIRSLPSVVAEVHEVSSFLTDCGISPDNIHKIYGGDLGAEVHFQNALIDHHEDLLLLHFAGHFGRSGLLLSDRDSTIESEEITDLLYERRLGETLVFLNGCFSGQIREIWDTEKNLSTAFLDAGASGCVCTLQSIPDQGAASFAKQFYQLILQDEIHLSIAEALRKARNETQGLHDIDRVLWTLYGYPDVVLLSEEYRL